MFFLHSALRPARWGRLGLTALLVALVVVGGLPPTAANGEQPSQHAGLDRRRILDAYAHLPITFEQNQGQLHPDAKFMSRGGGLTTYLTSDGAVFTMALPAAPGTQRARSVSRAHLTSPASSDETSSQDGEKRMVAVWMTLVGANAQAALTGQHPQAGVSHYLQGNQPEAWRTHVQHFGRVHYAEVYPGIDQVYYDDGGKLRYDFIVQPGTDPAAIQMRFAGMRRLALGADGDLLIHVGGADQAAVLRQHAPFTYQEIDGLRREIGSRFLVTGDTVAFALDEYDPTLPLIIDPAVVYSTFLGSTEEDLGLAITVDLAGNAVVAGETYAADFPSTAGTYDPSFNGTQDAFVIKLNATGTALLFASFLGGSSFDSGYGVAVDLFDNIYVTGITQSANFPTTLGAFDRSYNGPVNGYDAFVIKLNATGSSLVYGTYFGGTGDDFAAGITLTGGVHAYVAGTTNSTNLPTTLTAFDRTANGGNDIFVTKFNATGTGLLYSTLVGGNSIEIADGIAVRAGLAYVTGDTTSPNFPTTVGAFDTTPNGGSDVFVFRLDSTASSLGYSTLLGGSGDDIGFDITLDALGNTFVVGNTASVNFPTTATSFDTTANGDLDAFVTKLDLNASTVIFSTYLGGAGEDSAFGVSVDGNRSVYVVGETKSANFPTTANADDTTINDATFYDVFLTELNPGGAALIYSTYLGGTDDDTALAVRVDANFNVHLTGSTRSANFPTTVGAFDTTYNDLNVNNDAFAAKFALPTGPIDTIGVRRPTTGVFLLRNSNTTGSPDYEIPYGFTTDIGLTGDWDGDGIDTLGYYRPATTFFILSNQPAAQVVGSPRSAHAFGFGSQGDLPLAGDWNGDGRDSAGVYRPSNKTFYLRNALNAGFADASVTLTYAAAGDLPLVGDWDCDGRDTAGVYRPSNATFYLSNQFVDGTETVPDISLALGQANSLPFAGDWNGDLCSGVGVFRNGSVLLRNPLFTGPANVTFTFGAMGDSPFAGVWTVPPAPPAPIITRPEAAPTFEP
jgi:hypothetical protein